MHGAGTLAASDWDVGPRGALRDMHTLRLTLTFTLSHSHSHSTHVQAHTSHVNAVSTSAADLWSKYLSCPSFYYETLVRYNGFVPPWI